MTGWQQPRSVMSLQPLLLVIPSKNWLTHLLAKATVFLNLSLPLSSDAWAAKTASMDQQKQKTQKPSTSLLWNVCLTSQIENTCCAAHQTLRQLYHTSRFVFQMFMRGTSCGLFVTSRSERYGMLRMSTKCTGQHG